MSGPDDASLPEEQARTLSAVLDEVIPPSADGRFPGAGELGIAGHVEHAMQQTPGVGPVIAQGLSAAEELARGRSSDGFAALSAQDRVEVLNEVAAQQPAFLPILTLTASAGYYQNARVVEALGMEARPPFPKGHEMEPNDLSLLDEVRQRPRLFRPC
jgi:hypothetical protein